jgi:glycine dehydrogenase subunit 2
MLIFEHSRPGYVNRAQCPADVPAPDDLPERFLRREPPGLPEVGEPQVVRHYTRLSQKNFSIDTNFYPLGSCTMKHNPRACNRLAMLPGFLARHPAAHDDLSQGFLACLWDLQAMMQEVTGMAGIALSPAAGAQGEFAGVAMIRWCPTPRTAPTPPRR